MQNTELILTLTGGLSAALLFGYVTQRLGLSPIVGYLLAGLVVGPYTPGYVADHHLAEQMAEIGIILLMFGVGLHFHLDDLISVKGVALTGAVTQSAVATVLGALTTHFLGWSWPAGIVFGLALSVASTVVLTRVLADNQDLHTRTGRIAVGWLVTEDIFTVLVLVVMPAMFGPGAEQSNIWMAIGTALLKLGALAAFTFLIGGRIIPRFLASVSATHSRELFTLAVLALALGIAVGSSYIFGASMALGAFLAGMVVGQSEFSFRAASEALPMRDAFAVLFFVSVGMLFNPKEVWDSPVLVLVTLAVVVIGKPIAALGIVALLGYGSKVGLGVAVALAQIGEFSFILASLGKSLNVLPEGAMNALVAVAIASITLNPLFYRSVHPVERILSRYPRLWRVLNRKSRTESSLPPSHHVEEDGAPETDYSAVVVGYGPVGETVTRLLRDRGIAPTVIELNLETTRRLRHEGVPVVYGDANHPDILHQAGVEQAMALILTAPGSPESAELIRHARQMNSKIVVLARTPYLADTESVRKAGATEVFSAEGEVALAMTEYLLERLGTTPEQMDRERVRVRKALFSDGDYRAVRTHSSPS